MTRPEVSNDLLASVIARFPDHNARILRLALQDDEFQALCEEYNLARQSYGRLMVAANRAGEVAEYRTLIAELEDEIRTIILLGGETT